MTLKLTYVILSSSQQPLQQLGQLPTLSPDMKLRIAKVMKRYSDTFDKLLDTQKALQKEADEKFPKPSGAIVGVNTSLEAAEKERNEKRNAWLIEQSDKLFNEPCEVDCKPLVASKFGQDLPVAGHLLMLAWLIVVDVTKDEEETTH